MNKITHICHGDAKAASVAGQVSGGPAGRAGTGRVVQGDCGGVMESMVHSC